MTKKEKHIKEVNIRELNANWRTLFFVSVLASVALGIIIGYFGSIEIINNSQRQAIETIKMTLKDEQ